MWRDLELDIQNLKSLYPRSRKSASRGSKYFFRSQLKKIGPSHDLLEGWGGGVLSEEYQLLVEGKATCRLHRTSPNVSHSNILD